MNIKKGMNRKQAATMLGRLGILAGAVIGVVALMTIPFANSQLRDFFGTLIGGGAVSVAVWAIVAKTGNTRALLLVGCTLFFLSWLVYLSSWDGQVNKPALLIVELVSLAIILAFALSTHQQFNGRHLVFTPTGAELPVSRIGLIGGLVLGFGVLSILAWVLFPEQASDMNQIVLLIYLMLTLIGIFNTQRDIFFVLLLWVFPVVALLLLQIIAGPVDGNVFRWLWGNPDKWSWIGLAYLFHTGWFLTIFASKFAGSFVTQEVYGFVQNQFGGTLQRISDQLDEAITWSLFPVVFYFIVANLEWLKGWRLDVAGFWWPFIWMVFWAVLVKWSNEIREGRHWVILAVIAFSAVYFVLPWQAYLGAISAKAPLLGPVMGAVLVFILLVLLFRKKHRQQTTPPVPTGPPIPQRPPFADADEEPSDEDP